MIRQKPILGRVLICACLAACIDGCLSPDPFPYSQEIVWEDYEPELRKTLIARLNEPRYPYVSFANLHAWLATESLTLQRSQSVGTMLDEDARFSAVNLTMKDAVFCATLDEICRQTGMRWGFLENILQIHPDFELERSSKKWSQPGRAGLPPPASTAIRKWPSDWENDTAPLKTVRISWSGGDPLPARDIIDAVKTKAAEALAGQNSDTGFAVIVRPQPKKDLGKECHDITLHDVTINDAFRETGKKLGLRVVLTKNTFVFFDESEGVYPYQVSDEMEDEAP